MTGDQKRQNLVANIKLLLKTLEQQGIKHKDTRPNPDDPWGERLVVESEWTVYEDDPKTTFYGVLCNRANREAFLYLKNSGALNKNICWSCGQSPIAKEYTFSSGRDISFFVCKSCHDEGRGFQKEVLGAPNGAPQSNNNCFIATACYGDINAWLVEQFRNYRDEHLRNSYLGRLSIWFYYKVSPLMVKYLMRSKKSKLLVKKYLLDKILIALRKNRQCS